MAHATSSTDGELDEGKGHALGVATDLDEDHTKSLKLFGNSSLKSTVILVLGQA